MGISVSFDLSQSYMKNYVYNETLIKKTWL